VSFGQHALMKDARDQYASGVLTVKDNVPAAFHSTKAGADVVTWPAQRGTIGEQLATRLKIVDVADRLVFAPSPKGICADAEEVGFGKSRETKCGHGLALRRRKLECFPHTGKYITFSHSARISFIDGGTKHS
jgi:hypothetical protein